MFCYASVSSTTSTKGIDDCSVVVALSADFKRVSLVLSFPPDILTFDEGDDDDGIFEDETDFC